MMKILMCAIALLLVATSAAAEAVEPKIFESLLNDDEVVSIASCENPDEYRLKIWAHNSTATLDVSLCSSDAYKLQSKSGAFDLILTNGSVELTRKSESLPVRSGSTQKWLLENNASISVDSLDQGCFKDVSGRSDRGEGVVILPACSGTEAPIILVSSRKIGPAEKSILRFVERAKNLAVAYLLYLGCIGDCRMQ